VNRVWPARLAAAFTRRRWGSKGCQRCVWPFAASCGVPSSWPLFSVTSLPSVTSSILWASPTSDRDATPGDGLPFPGAPAGDQPADPVGPLGFRYQPSARDLLLAPGGAAALSHSESGHAAFAGAFSSSASATSPFRDSIRSPMHLLSTLRTPRYHDARKTRCWPVCSTLARPDFHQQADTSFPNAQCIGLPKIAFQHGRDGVRPMAVSLGARGAGTMA